MTDKHYLTAEDAARILRISKYTLYELVKRGEMPAQKVGRQLRFDQDVLHRYIQGGTEQPAENKESENRSNTKLQGELRFVGSHDPIIELVIQFMMHSTNPVSFMTSFQGSMEGLIALYRRKANVAGVHLWDEQTKEYNLPFIHYVLPGEAVIVVNLVQRIQGWIVPPGNPHQLNAWGDITTSGLRFVNRQKGSGTRIKLDSFLRTEGISPATIEGYEIEEQTHVGVACRIASGEADAAIGVQAAAEQLGLDFVPLFHERYDIVCLEETSHSTEWRHLMDILKSSQFQRAIHSRSGYDTTLTGSYILGGEQR